VLLKEALLIAAKPGEGQTYRLSLCCSFEPLHFRTFLKARVGLRLSPKLGEIGRSAEVLTGLFGDLSGNIQRAVSDSEPIPLVVVVDWADLDPRLGLREGYLVASNMDASIVSEASARLARLEQLLAAAVEERRIVLVLPTSPLPPWLLGLPEQESTLALELQALAIGFAARCARSGVRVAASIPGNTYDFRAHIGVGCPFPNTYADLLAEAIAALLLPIAPMKGLIADLDNTLWKGVVGDDGAANVQWSLEAKARIHGLFQQFLGGLHTQGALLGIASKNDPEPVAEALARSELLFPSAALFPVETSWGPKSESIRRIAARWNIGLDAIVFVDDNPLELAEVQMALPEVECHLFPASDPVEALKLISTLRARFARDYVTDEDRMRTETIRRAAELDEVPGHSDQEILLTGLEGHVTLSFSRVPYDSRALELLNKTNQFNLNGERWEESEFRGFLTAPDGVLCVVSYDDRFGPLGKIAVAAGAMKDGILKLRSWVLSCRAFSRRIEYSMLKGLFVQTEVEAIELAWKSTSRNGPTRDLLAVFFEPLPPEGSLLLSRPLFEGHCPALYARLQVAE
jgi:FkbH-like protein